MQKAIPLTLCLLLLSFQDAAPVAVTDRKYTSMTSGTFPVSHIRKNETEISSEGGHIDAYYDNTGSRIITEHTFAVMSEHETQLYFDPGNQLILVQDRNITHATPMYDSAFTHADDKAQTWRYYFQNRKLIKWTGPKAKDSANRQYRDQQASWLDYSDNIVKQMTKYYTRNPHPAGFTLPVTKDTE